MSLMDKGIRFTKKEKFDIVRRVIAHATSRSWKEVPHVSYVYDADVSKLFQFYQDNKEKLNINGKITINTIMMKIISEGLIASPELNAHLQFNPKNKTGTLKMTSDVNIALPWLLDDGRMITPNVKNVEQKSLSEIANYVNDLARRIGNTDIDAMQYKVGLQETLSEVSKFKISVLRQVIAAKIGAHKLRKPTGKQRKAYGLIPDCDKLTPNDIFGSSMLVSNIGSMFKTQKGALTLLEIVAPQVLVVGLNLIQDRATVIVNDKGEKEIAIRQILPITITWDHRAADTANIVPFQNEMDKYFNNPELILNWV